MHEEQGEQVSIIYSDIQYIVKITLSMDEDGNLTAAPEYWLYSGSGDLPAATTENLDQESNSIAV